MRFEFEDYKTKLCIPVSVREDSGKYLLKAENASGKDEHEIDVIVQGKIKDHGLEHFIDICIK